MAKSSNNIDIDIFMVLKACEKSKVTPLFLGNPGIGKSSAVSMFCQIRGYELLILRGSSSSPEELLGYDVANEKVSETGYAKKLFPSWFQEIMDNEAQGKPTLLFLDELSTCNEFTQAAMLEIIFSRRVSGKVFLPDDCFVVSAGNYFANLSSSFNMIPPILNRFALINLTPTVDDLDVFLNKYEGCISGKRKNFMDELKKDMVKLDNQELTIAPEMEGKIGESIERAIKETTRYLISNGTIDLTVAELSNLYSDDNGSGDPSVYGFVTFRTLNYLRDMTIAYYTCFGKAGIKSANYRKTIDGLCGIGLSWDKATAKTGGDPKKTKIGKEYLTAIVSAVNDIEKMSIGKLPEYEKYFYDSTDNLKELDVPIMQAIYNKIEELKNDQEIHAMDLERPIDPEVIRRLCDAALETAKNSVNKINVSTSNVLAEYPVEKIIGYVTSWNTMTDLMNVLGEFVTNSKLGYKENDVNKYKETIENLRTSNFKLRSIKKLLNLEQPSLAATIPDLKKFTVSA